MTDYSDWEELGPNKRSYSRGCTVTMRAKLLAGGGTTVTVWLSPELAAQCGSPTHCRVRAVQVGANEGKFRIIFDGDGPIKLGALANTRTIRAGFRAPAWFEPGDRDSEEVAFQDEGPDGVTLTVRPQRRPTAATNGALFQKALAPDTGALIDVAGELAPRKVDQLAGGRWQIDGDTYTPEAVATLLTKVRSRKGLAPVTAKQLARPA